MKHSKEKGILEKLNIFFRKIFPKERQLLLPEKQNDINNISTNKDKLKHIKIDTTISNLKISLEMGYKKVSQLSNNELKMLIPIYEKEIIDIEKKIEYKKLLLKK